MDTVARADPMIRSDAVERAEFTAFAEPHWADLARLARRLAPPGGWEDVLQEALSNAWRKRHQFDASKGTARNWLLAIVADQARKGVRRLRVHQELVDAPDADADGALDVDLVRALATVTTRQRTAITLHYYLGLPLADIAAVMGCSVGTVKSTLSDGRARLRRELGEDYR